MYNSSLVLINLHFITIAQARNEVIVPRKNRRLLSNLAAMPINIVQLTKSLIGSSDTLLMNLYHILSYC